MELCQSNAATAQCLDSDWMNLSLLHGGKISRPATLTPNDLLTEEGKMPAEDICNLAGEIASRVNDRWCGWEIDTGCVRFRIATVHCKANGERVWMPIGGCTLEYLELIVCLGEVSRQRAVDRLVQQMRRFVDSEVFSVPRN